MNLGSAAFRSGKLDQAKEHYTEAIRLFEEAGLGDSMDGIGAEANLGILERRLGHHDAAATRLENAKAKAKRALGEAHPSVGNICNSLAVTYVALERFAEAEAQYRESLALLERKVGADASRVGHPLNNLGEFLVDRGRAEEAVPLLTRCIEVWTRHDGADSEALAAPLTSRGEGLLSLGRQDEAKADLQRARGLLAETASPDEKGRLLLLLARAFVQTDPARADAFIEDARALKITKPTLENELAAWVSNEP